MSLEQLIKNVSLKLHLSDNEAFDKLNIIADVVKDEIFVKQRLEHYGFGSEIIEPILTELLKENLISKYFSYECQKLESIEYAVSLNEQCTFCGEILKDFQNNHIIRETYKLNSNFLELVKKAKDNQLKQYLFDDFYINLTKLKENSHRIIPFVGAGVSVPFKLPNWGQLLQGLEKGLIDENKIQYNKLIERGDYLRALTFLKRYSGYYKKESLIKKEIKDIIKKSYQKPPNNNLHNINDLLKLNSQFILTTNYDNIISDYLRNYLDDLVLPKNLQAIDDVQDLIDENQPRAIHLHGNVDEINSMIVTKEDYDELYGSEKIKHVLTSIMGNKKLLFIGFSFQDDYFKDLYEKITNHIGGGHFILVPNLHPFDAEELFDKNLIPIGIKVKKDKSDFVIAIRTILEQLY
ncbi:SIR2 family protein [Bacillus sp. AFS053548]|uniref:SIR2 family protein n=1 Tax=Bacillus sp. AFS053548 TaxID=2033505 RepID=UPI000BFDAA84|nr:SIR2 family protein [Bacillus sp. AFS053548]PGM59904.1 hypothetical protein CN946_00405 [Bacillus sp. AFS053548]